MNKRRAPSHPPVDYHPVRFQTQPSPLAGKHLSQISQRPASTAQEPPPATPPSKPKHHGKALYVSSDERLRPWLCFRRRSSSSMLFIRRRGDRNVVFRKRSNAVSKSIQSCRAAAPRAPNVPITVKFRCTATSAPSARPSANGSFGIDSRDRLHLALRGAGAKEPSLRRTDRHYLQPRRIICNPFANSFGRAGTR